MTSNWNNVPGVGLGGRLAGWEHNTRGSTIWWEGNAAKYQVFFSTGGAPQGMIWTVV
jgi:hypothetical protein